MLYHIVILSAQFQRAESWIRNSDRLIREERFTKIISDVIRSTCHYPRRHLQQGNQKQNIFAVEKIVPQRVNETTNLTSNSY